MKLSREKLLEEFDNFDGFPKSKSSVARIIIEKYGLNKTVQAIRKRIARALKGRGENIRIINNKPELFTGARILFFDLETFPMEGFFWHQRQENIPRSMVTDEGYMLCWSAKWANESEVLNDSIPNYRTLTKKESKYNSQDDREITASILKLLDQCDIAVGHNIDKFDKRVFQTHALKHGFMPPSPYTTIDTLKVARKEFKCSSNRLDDLGKFLNCGRKSPHSGFETWKECAKGNKEHWEIMTAYNDQDVLLLEEVYHKLLPWIKNHPNVALHDEHEKTACHKCGSEDLIPTTKKKATKVGLYNLLYCSSCFSWQASRENTLDTKQRKYQTKSA